MLDMDDPDEVIAASGKFTTALTTAAGDVGTVVDDLVLHSRADSPLDRALVQKLEWIHTTFGNAVSAAGSQAETTRDITVVGARAISNSDIDGGTAVRSVEV
ncbi:hypothetical protein [Nocardia sp. NBC_01329]|uniref:hypothetical protein n=1 Tax=Nocardia sp. NBC_01329 TaxID=2903594 RepID=UPI002E14032F|nr:hypothetical protein OG405_20125 [Nocardia sp. NBC_01329]